MVVGKRGAEKPVAKKRVARADLRARLIGAGAAGRARLLDHLSDSERAFVAGDFALYRHDGQAPPGGAWRNWVLMAGRGFGKTRVGAEWIWSLVRHTAEPLSIALVGATIDEARNIMVDGPSGILALQQPGDLVQWHAARGLLLFRSGSEARLFSGAHGERLRGPEHHYAWCDELAKWKQGEAAWNNLQMGLRAGAAPQCLITTTPRPSPLMKMLLATPGTVVSGGATHDNPHLSPAFCAAMSAQYGGTRLERQEIDGMMLTDVQGSLWPDALVRRCRLPAPAAQYDRIVIGVDPPASARGTCGIVVAGIAGERGGGADARVAHVIADRSLGGASPETWARAVVRAASRFGADRIVAEGNQGGDMVRSVLMAANPILPLTISHASQSKMARAEPVAALFENGRAFFAGRFPALEEQLAGMVAGGDYEGPGPSPDRADAMVWAMHELMLKQTPRAPAIRRFA